MTDQEKIEARMTSDKPFTFGELWRSVGGSDSSHPSYRMADRTIQKWRREGWIHFVRVGRDTLWSLTDAGKAKFKKD